MLSIFRGLYDKIQDMLCSWNLFDDTVENKHSKKQLEQEPLQTVS